METPVIKPQELINLQPRANLVMIDCRTGPGVLEKYRAEHLEGALFVDLEKDLARKGIDPADGGRHPLPNISKFSKLLGQLGITPDSQVVVYDDKNGANAAARFWWMLKAIGHKQVQVLDGGYDAALAAGIPTSSGIEKPPQQSPYRHSNWKLPTVTIDEVESAAKSPGWVVIDVRDADRYRGEKEPIDSVAGHIPGAINIPFTGNLDEHGFFLSPAELHTKYTAAIGNFKPEQVVVHCGSGVTACHTILAMSYAGIKSPNLYVGSWSEWSRRDYPIATELR